MEIQPTPDQIVALTPLWTGDRSDDGRPLLADDLLAELRRASAEQAYYTLTRAGYDLQFAGGWQQSHPGWAVVGRALTAQFVPFRPDFDAVVVEAGARAGHTAPLRQNSWVIDTLKTGDVMVADIFGKIVEGTVVGDNLGTAAATRTGTGLIINGGVRDLDGLQELEKVNFFFKGAHPSAIKNVTLAGINLPIRIDDATVLPGDIVLATATGVTFIPPHLVADVVNRSSGLRLRDEFGKLRLAQGRYSSAEIDVAEWPDAIRDDFEQWKLGQARGA